MGITRKEIFFFLDLYDLPGIIDRYQNPRGRKELIGSILFYMRLIRIFL